MEVTLLNKVADALRADPDWIALAQMRLKALEYEGLYGAQCVNVAADDFLRRFVPMLANSSDLSDDRVALEKRSVLCAMMIGLAADRIMAKYAESGERLGGVGKRFGGTYGGFVFDSGKVYEMGVRIRGHYEHADEAPVEIIIYAPDDDCLPETPSEIISRKLRWRFRIECKGEGGVEDTKLSFSEIAKSPRNELCMPLMRLAEFKGRDALAMTSYFDY